jgi:hypothetical protein
MRAMILAAVVGLGSACAFAGPSDHWSRQPADFRPSAQSSRTQRAPYALTGDRVQRRVLVTRDVPRGRGQTERASYWTWVTE